jgi:hypothetical protein
MADRTGFRIENVVDNAASDDFIYSGPEEVMKILREREWNHPSVVYETFMVGVKRLENLGYTPEQAKEILSTPVGGLTTGGHIGA